MSKSRKDSQRSKGKNYRAGYMKSVQIGLGVNIFG